MARSAAEESGRTIVATRPVIFVAEAAASPADVLAGLPAPDASRHALRWVYLGTDDAAACRWRRGLAAFGPPEDIADHLQRTAEAYRQPFLRWLTRMAAAGTEGWWITRLSERNTYSESIFQDLCYVEVVRQLASPGASPLLVVAGSGDLLETIERSAARHASEQEPPQRIVSVGRRSASSRSVARALRAVARSVALWGYYFGDAARTLAAARLSRLVAGRRAVSGATVDRTGSGKRILLHTCIDDVYFEGDEGRDRYFTELPGVLRGAGHDVVTLPWLYNISRSKLSVLLWLRTHGRHLIPEDYYRPWDYVRSATAVVHAAGQIPTTGSFEGIDLSVLLRAARDEQRGAYGLARFVQYRDWVRRLAAQGVRFDVVVDSFENYGSERAFTMALRAESPDTLIVGFQHFMVPLPFQLAHWSLPEEWPLVPCADVIVCTAPMNVPLLGKMGFPASRLRVGPSLRFLHLLQPAAIDAPAKGEADLVLILLPSQTDLACELIRKVLDALDGERDLRLRVKFHPMMNARHRERIIKAGGRARMPPDVTGAVDAQLAGAACAVGAATNACIEVLLRGVPYVPVGRDTAFEMNPLHWFDDAPALCRTPDAIRLAVRSVTGDRAVTARERARAWARRHKADCLSPLNEVTMQAFLAGTNAGLEPAALAHAR